MAKKTSQKLVTQHKHDMQVKLCSQPKVIQQQLEADINPLRANFIIGNNKKWANGTELTFCFMNGAEKQRIVVRNAFKTWKSLGIGITFKEVAKSDSSILRIGFVLGDGSWSYVGRDNLTVKKADSTMNFGWDLTADSYGMTTALHEIGHAIGFQHEHQSPFSGIEWDTNAVYKSFSLPPNNWSKATIDHNIISKLPPNELTGSAWDADSIMEYEFGPGLIKKPVAFQNGVYPRGVLSENDKKGVKSIYPVVAKSSQKSLELLKAEEINVKNGDQSDFVFVAPDTAKYTFQTVGNMDTVMIVNEMDKTTNHYLAGSDDSGTSNNSKLSLPLVQGRKYLISVRVMYAESNNGGIIVTN